MIKLKEFIQRAKVFINENPQRKKLLLIIFILSVIPLTVIAALTVQNLQQHAGGGNGVRISDQGGNTLFSTYDPNVFIDIDSNAIANWVLPQSNGSAMNNSLIRKAYAQTAQCRPPYQGFLGCFSSSNRPFGSVCTSSCTTDDGQTGEWCYTSTSVGNSCTSSAGQNGVCNEQGECVASVYGAPIYSTPQFTANCGKLNCSSDQTCIGTSFDSSTFCLKKNIGALGSYCGTPSKSPNSEVCSSGYCDSTLHCVNQSQATTPIPTNPTPTATVILPTGINPTSGPTPTPTLNILRAVYIENKDTDGSTGGSNPVKIVVKSGADIAHTPWKLHDLLPGQTQAPRIVQVTLIGDNLAVPFITSVNLVKSTHPVYPTPIYYTPYYTPPVSSTVNSIPKSNSNIPSSPPTSTNYKNFDLNNDRVVNCKDTKILVSQYAQKGTNLSVDLNRDGIVDGIDLNTLLRNYTPGDTTVCN